ncbi:penicillin-binding protein activator [Methylomagnum sp.]
MRQSLRPVLSLVLASTLAGCAGLMPRWGGAPPSDPQAEGLFRAGDYEGAMRRYEYLARTSPYPDYYWLQAADAALRAGDGHSAQQIADAINPKELEGQDRNQYLLLAGRLDLNAGRAREAMAKLSSIGPAPLQGAQPVNYHTLRASAYNQLGDMLASAKERIELGPLLSQPEAVKKNNDAIYDALARLPSSVLSSKQPPPPDTLGGWMSLTQILKTASPGGLSSALNQWRNRYPRHPANGAFLDNAFQEAGGTVVVTPLGKPQADKSPVAATPETNTQPPTGPFVGVLLPLSGPYAPASQAIRSGLIAAYYADTNPAKTPLHFVDSQSGDVGQLYKKLAEQGATSVIGPLTKENVGVLAKSGDLPIPVLALNQTNGVDNPQIYQFGLTPEHEVEQAAGSAWFDNRQTALVLAPSTPFGQRMIQHFTNYWRGLDGKIATVKTYSPHGQDFTAAVESLLGTLPSQPAASLTSTADNDFIFLIADTRDARLILPQIAANQPRPIPVYATSRVYSGKADEPADQDLNGLIFCDIPWLLNVADGSPLSARALESQIKQTQGDYVRLIALGLDAYRLQPELDRGKLDPHYRFSGATGLLSLQSGNRIQRQLECAQFDSGHLQLRGTAPIPQAGTPAASRP